MTEGRTLEELGREIEMEVARLPVDQIDPDPDNPNLVDEPLYDALVADIRDNGFVQPVLVRRDGDRYRMIDGEHRWRAVQELGYSEIPAVISTEQGDDAKLRLLTMNRLRGEFVPIRLAYVLADLATRIPEDELRRRLGMDASEMRDNLRLAEFTDDLADRLAEDAERERRAAPKVLTFVLENDRDAAVIERAVGSLSSEKLDRGQALARICRQWEKSRKDG